MMNIETENPLTAVESSGQRLTMEAVPVAALVAGEAVITAWGDGRLRIFRADSALQTIDLHRGAILSMALAADLSVLTGGDDGRFVRTTPEGETETLAELPRKWVDHVATGSNGNIACSVGREVHVREPAGFRQVLEHPSTVGGIAFDRKSKRLAVAHYGGVTIWSREARRWKSSALKWAGSHTRVSWSPDDRFLMTAMQENALHGWRMRDKADLTMSGYPAKVSGLVWTGALPWLATTGADSAILWPFDGARGPMGREPLQLCSVGGGLVTAICTAPGREVILAGFSDGSVVFSEIGADAESFVVRRGQGAAVSAVAVTASGMLFVADEAGRVLWVSLAGRTNQP
ncbi:WD40 repeat domain-containing protein [Paracoccus alkanivorans]|uniref:WD40 repeat domain-containing protein n=1 Tax=Paracoccus alkanivorans TaxID=2116655 RepID=A0A3M0MHX6_9RHOB|nr:WD40 repeat domain-containing protein [Paracoccus alkanivorans]RMC37251.1 WD40 repeat domain-containing protein [Paracoccus alkanivorans]